MSEFLERRMRIRGWHEIKKRGWIRIVLRKEEERMGVTVATKFVCAAFFGVCCECSTVETTCKWCNVEKSWERPK